MSPEDTARSASAVISSAGDPNGIASFIDRSAGLRLMQTHAGDPIPRVFAPFGE